MNTGRITSDIAVSRHSRRNMMTRVKITDTMFEARDMNVPVTACWAPTTSLLRRLINSPVRVAVKNPSDMRCRWENS